jgi:hypothetical protein
MITAWGCDEVKILAEELCPETDRAFSLGDFYANSVAGLKLRRWLSKACRVRRWTLVGDLLPRLVIDIFTQLTAYTDKVEKPICLRRRDTLLGKDVAVSHLKERSTTRENASTDSEIPEISNAVEEVNVVGGAWRPETDAIRTRPVRALAIHIRDDRNNLFMSGVWRDPARILGPVDNNSRDSRQWVESRPLHAADPKDAKHEK